MLTWDDTTIDALLSMGHLFPHLMFVGSHEHELYDTLRTFLGKIDRSATDSDVLVHECETQGGIAAVREVLRPFTRSPRHPRPTLVILRRFDRLSPDAQFALRRTMEIDQDKCRCLAVATNTASIIQPLHSRFVIVGCDKAATAAATAAEGAMASEDVEPKSQLVSYKRLMPMEPWPAAIDELAHLTAAKAMEHARGGMAACDVLRVVESWAARGEVPWRLAVAAVLVASRAVDEAAGLYLIGMVCRNWINRQPFVCYAS